jgi:hypothetical protein
VTLLRAWNAPSLVSRVAIDAATKTAAAENADVTGLAAAAGGLSWTQLDRALPLPVSFEDATVELAEKAGADLESLDQQRLQVTALAAGRYELKIDGQTIGTFTDAELAKGVNLARYNTPMRWQAFAVAWSAGDGHELQKLRRRLLVAPEKDASLKTTIDVLAAQDEADQAARSERAVPKLYKVELVPVK